MTREYQRPGRETGAGLSGGPWLHASGAFSAKAHEYAARTFSRKACGCCWVRRSPKSSRSRGALRRHVDSDAHGGLGRRAHGLGARGKLGAVEGARRPHRRAARSHTHEVSPALRARRLREVPGADGQPRLPQLGVRCAAVRALDGQEHPAATRSSSPPVGPNVGVAAPRWAVRPRSRRSAERWRARRRLGKRGHHVDERLVTDPLRVAGRAARAPSAKRHARRAPAPCRWFLPSRDARRTRWLGKRLSGSCASAVMMMSSSHGAMLGLTLRGA